MLRTNWYHRGPNEQSSISQKTGANPDEAQMLDSRKLSIEEVARMFRVPPHMIGITTPGAMSYASVEQNNINFVVHTLRPYISKIEDAYSRLLPTVAFLKFNVDGLLRGDFQTRIAGYSTGLQSGFYSVNDVRRFEDVSRLRLSVALTFLTFEKEKNQIETELIRSK